jgi:hypothetical protein
MSTLLYTGPGVYEIKCNVNGRSYFGQTDNIPERIGGHIRELNSNRMINMELQEDWNKYGSAKFTFNLLDSSPECEGLRYRLDVETSYVRKNLHTCYNEIRKKYIQQEAIEASRNAAPAYSRGTRKVIELGNSTYKSKSQAQRALKLGRCKFDTLLHTGRLDAEARAREGRPNDVSNGLPNPPAEERKITIDGVTYSNVYAVPNVDRQGPGFVFKRLMNKDDVSAFFVTEGYQPLKRQSNRIMAAGIEFASMDLCAAVYNTVDKSTLYKRCQSLSYPNWYAIPGHL